MSTALIALAVVFFFVVLFAISAIKVAREYERGIVFRLGRFERALEYCLRKLKKMRSVFKFNE